MDKFLSGLSAATKAVLTTGFIGLPEFPTILNGLTAYLGIGTMPPPDDLQKAIVQCLLAIVGGLVVYQMPNAKQATENRAENVETKSIEENPS
jgi:hypothetical protein